MNWVERAGLIRTPTSLAQRGFFLSRCSHNTVVAAADISGPTVRGKSVKDARYSHTKHPPGLAENQEEIDTQRSSQTTSRDKPAVTALLELIVPTAVPPSQGHAHSEKVTTHWNLQVIVETRLHSDPRWLIMPARDPKEL